MPVLSLLCQVLAQATGEAQKLKQILRVVPGQVVPRQVPEAPTGVRANHSPERAPRDWHRNSGKHRPEATREMLGPCVLSGPHHLTLPPDTPALPSPSCLSSCRTRT